MIDWEKVQWGSVAQWISAGATFVAVIVALWKEQIIAWFRRPKLTIRALPSPPDSDKIQFIYSYLLPGAPSDARPFKGSVDSYFLRLWIQNEGKSRAENVQVFVARLYRMTANGTFASMDSFIPMNLLWSWSSGSEKPTRDEVFADGISPGMGVHCNLAYVLDPARRKALCVDHPDAKQEQTVLILTTEMKPTNYCHILAPDNVYQLELRIAGSNCRPTSHTVELTHTGKWFEDKERMFQEGVMMQMETRSSRDKAESRHERLLRRGQKFTERGAAK
jgi:hypothetical protein